MVVTREIRKGGVSSGDKQAYKRDGADISLDFRDNAAGKRFGGKTAKGSAGPEWAQGKSEYVSSNDGNGKVLL